MTDTFETFSENDQKKNRDENQKTIEGNGGFRLVSQSKHYKYKLGQRTNKEERKKNMKKTQ